MNSELTASQRPGKIIAVHINYRSRAEQRGRTPEHPSYFLKPSTSVGHSGSPVERPLGTELLAFEGEIALIIGHEARCVSPGDGWSHVRAVTAANDFGVYDLRYADKGSNLRSKGGDGFTPLGPALIPAEAVDPAALRVRTWLNGDLVQEGDTGELFFSFGQLVADLSQLLTLEPGDTILTGTPAGASVTQPGDIVEVEVDAPDAEGAPSTGRLVTPVIEATVPLADYGALPRVDDQQRAEAWGSAEAADRADNRVLSGETRAALDTLAIATLSAQLRKRGLDNVSVDGVRPLASGTRVVGVARTLRYLPLREDLFAAHGGGLNAQKRAIEAVGPGEVLVMEARGERTAGTIGDILALRAQMNGAAGIVTDGGVRDSAAVASLGLPVYAAAEHPAVLGRRHVPWESDVTIACGGTTVQPGDVIVGDDDGLVVIPPHLLEEVVADAVEQERQEEFITEQVRAGHGIEGLYPLSGAWLEAYREWKE
ncbi:regulator of RNase E activity RraA/2-keto-4-pentenoate hydratase/2-oxohepta-3-ene-1,7-dioic acid hydratase in catechol pathway [Lipingzhangella halophila]|uniref:Regulator of RNase E activity RraA/2-keto-4-pentenoate hydratase/2-oxohepta-3-ene-1,7-dioic acid hydratase in catechol pathway n=1 Tax=Lipingzhangella halophila TaxID=1783352 RepID=A0A7W7W1D5_9ACTN|nr:fumarylacetoacetate hydrolase family protein [Lipingzhangella halophila]MBB4929580.1 regulator of RNase E activity RraA/2-keto-4-pentenoate hydratase/2-oxohepta-3-ene-1,7-dioic acid hydratase in catechol pathway [Lipingzhangella halophila]